MDYTKLFSVPMWIAVACLVIMALTYPGARRVGGDRPVIPPVPR
jgi:hypothetical protein